MCIILYNYIYIYTVIYLAFPGTSFFFGAQTNNSPSCDPHENHGRWQRIESLDIRQGPTSEVLLVSWWTCGDRKSWWWLCLLMFIAIPIVFGCFWCFLAVLFQYYTDACVHGGLHCRRKAGASKWTKSGPSGPSRSSWLLFRGPKNGAKNRPQKRGRNITGRRKGFQNGGPISGTRVLHTQSAPLCVQWVAETSEHFVCFPANWLDKSLIQVSQYYTDACVHGSLRCRRKAGASKWTKSGLSGPSRSSWLLFRGPKNGAKNRPQKRGRNIAGRRKGFQNGGPISGTRVLHTQSAPLCVQWVAETSEHFVCFPANWLDKASSKFHIEGPPSRLHFSCADAVPKAGPGGSTVRAQADWQPNALSTT